MPPTWHAACNHLRVIRFTSHHPAPPAPHRLVVRIEGAFTADSIDDLRRLIPDELSTGFVSCDLSGLVLLDPDARDYLRSLRRAGAYLSGGSLYIQALIEETAP